MPMLPKPAPTMVTDGVRALDANENVRNGRAGGSATIRRQTRTVPVLPVSVPLRPRSPIGRGKPLKRVPGVGSTPTGGTRPSIGRRHSGMSELLLFHTHRV